MSTLETAEEGGISRHVFGRTCQLHTEKAWNGTWNLLAGLADSRGHEIKITHVWFHADM